MTKKVNSMDGFTIPRRAQSGPALNGGSKPKAVAKFGGAMVQPAETSVKSKQLKDLPQSQNIASGKKKDAVNIDMTLDGKEYKEKVVKVKSKKKKRIIIAIVAVLLLIALCVGGWFAYKFISTGSKIFKGNVVEAIFSQGKPLQQDVNGRSNILIFGTSEDDPNHPGGDLTDSIMIASVDQNDKDVFLISVPRDLYVNYDRACPAGYRGKINALYSCVIDSGEEAAQRVLADKIGEVFGLDMQYVVHLNYTVLREAVDAVGGVTVEIESSDPRGILDRNFDWDCPNGNSTCYNVKYPNGLAELDGKAALYLARARGADPLGRTYGLAQANFDREVYQRKILIALKEKAVSAGVLSNPVAVNNLLDALGDNIRTTFDAEEIKTLMKLGQDIESANIKSIVLNDAEAPLVTTGMVDGQSVVVPSAGTYNYNGIQEYVEAYSRGDLSVIEGASVDVFNATEQAGAAQSAADKLEANGLAVGVIGNAPSSLNTQSVQIFDMSDGEYPMTRAKLESVLGVQVSDGVSTGVNSDADFIVVIGDSEVAE